MQTHLTQFRITTLAGAQRCGVSFRRFLENNQPCARFSTGHATSQESVALVMAWAKRPLEDEHDEKWTVGRARM